MWKGSVFFFFFLFSLGLWAQDIAYPYQTKKIAFTKDTITLDATSINRSFFKVLNAQGSVIDTSFYKIDFQKSKLIFKNTYVSQDSITIRFLKFPDFLTKTYAVYDSGRIVPNEAGSLYVIKKDPVKPFKPFDGLNTSGSITRGVTIGNNQNTSVNSNLDLQITGRLSNKVSLRASIQDSNIPMQSGGYSQKLDEFDQIFIELFSDTWNIRAGDLFLENRQSQFLNFNKKVQGLSTRFRFGTKENQTDVFVAGAVVRGHYAKSSFTGQEGNQGPYKLKGTQGELYVLVISGSERVYVNGLLLKRGENNDYTIDYNAGEIKFTSLFPITSEMRIVVEYQYSDRNYTRFVTYGGVNHQAETWSLGSYIYSESDVKNQPLQQNLSADQVAILQNAGDDPSLMNAPSAYLDTYSENKILYKKITVNGVTVYQYSNNATDELYNVKFTYMGANLGNYVLSNTATIGKIYYYVPPVNGIPQGSYEPIIKLIPPTKLQIATVVGKYNPSEKTLVDFEAGVSNNDQNLFSTIDDNNNKGIASKFTLKQRVYTGTFSIDVFGNYQLVQNNFKTVERLFSIEFNRDWNITDQEGTKSIYSGGLLFDLKERGSLKYQMEKLQIGTAFSGIKHGLQGTYKAKNIQVQHLSSYLTSTGMVSNSNFFRNQSRLKYFVKKNWVGSSVRLEDNQIMTNATQQLTALSQRFSELGAFIGRGDSTRVYAEMGYLHRNNDSVQSGVLTRVNRSSSYYIKSKLIQNQKTNLSFFANYRQLRFNDATKPEEPSLNSRIVYSDSFWNQFLALNTVYETASGTIAQQEFTYLQVNPGQGIYMWNDYNGDGIQQLQEFEVAPFPDLAKYVRVFLPNQIFIKTNQNKYSQTLTINPARWNNGASLKKLLSYFYNQTALSLDRKVARTGAHFNLNPFSFSDDNLLGLNSSLRNSLFFNRGKQHHSVTYTFLESRTKSLLSIGTQENNSSSNQLQYAHLLQKSWLFNADISRTQSSSISDTYTSRNYQLKSIILAPKVSYIFSNNKSLSLFYEYKTKSNAINDQETLSIQRLGLSFNYSSERKITCTGEFSLYNNAFIGNANTPVAFQMLEGLQAGKNSTWRFLLQKNLTQYLDININYQGRKSNSSPVIHTGNVQLRAFF
ncbi:hypothetical protein [Flavobacterium aciduliphilum]|uniref:Outer membrane beta-barrel protein n=1 Tax=Flavobacterium aciduliphilum TaxID=1101402 RepID=A0A328YFK5_9FLAO|nr:hypothetical protein [Flavobacterium aciduliphilum]RAR72791.1 hypothetical protein CLV55_10450 [Flavobacterium aciduliphilum]